MNKLSKIFVFCCLLSGGLKSQDTFSILAFDSISGEVGAAGASCVDLFVFSQYSNDFITELFPGEGAIATQASYLPANQVNARTRFINGDSPSQIINWLQTHDDLNDPTVRQYGVVRMNTGYPKSAAHTGSNCMTYRNHITGPNYSIQGNILLGQKVLDSMEARFNREKGDLACKLMAAMQGAKMKGADTRCAGNNSSSLFAFLKVAQPTDTFGQNSFLLSLKTHMNDSIEPIDSLQTLFNAARTCTHATVGLPSHSVNPEAITLIPNPASSRVFIKTTEKKQISFWLYEATGRKIGEFTFCGSLDFGTEELANGVYFAVFLYPSGNQVKRIVVAR